MSDSNLNAAQEVHHKLEFYLVALAFTVAAFAMQTGNFSGNRLGDTAEVSSWLLFTLSGLVGLWRLEYVPVVYRIHEYVERRKSTIEQYGQDSEHADDIKVLQEQVHEYEPNLQIIEAANRKKYFWQKLFLVVGLFALFLARFILRMKEWYW
jgi:hypothetical protein